MKRSLYGFAVLTTVAVLAATSALAGGRSLFVKGQACQGANYFNGGVVSDYANTRSFLPPPVFEFWNQGPPPPLGDGNGFRIPEVGVIDPVTGKGGPVTELTPLDWVMGSLDGLILPVGNEPDDSVRSVPLNEMPVIYDSRGVEAVDPDGPDNAFVRNRRLPLPPGDPTLGNAALVRNAPLNEPITLERWNKARGFAILKCRADGTGSVRVVMRNLIPQMPYTAWQVFADPVQVIVPGPLGGVPNVIIPDKRGFAVYQRELHYCPLDLEPNPLMYIAILLHSDQMVYGAYFDQAGLDDGAALPIGFVSADHLCIPTGNSLIFAR